MAFIKFDLFIANILKKLQYFLQLILQIFMHLKRPNLIENNVDKGVGGVISKGFSLNASEALKNYKRQGMCSCEDQSSRNTNIYFHST